MVPPSDFSVEHSIQSSGISLIIKEKPGTDPTFLSTPPAENRIKKHNQCAYSWKEQVYARYSKSCILRVENHTKAVILRSNSNLMRGKWIRLPPEKVIGEKKSKLGTHFSLFQIKPKRVNIEWGCVPSTFLGKIEGNCSYSIQNESTSEEIDSLTLHWSVSAMGKAKCHANNRSGKVRIEVVLANEGSQNHSLMVIKVVPPPDVPTVDLEQMSSSDISAQYDDV